MGNNVTPDRIRGFLVGTKSIDNNSIWDQQSTFTQKNPRAGIPESSQITSGMLVNAVGDQESDLTIITTEGGTAGETARFNWVDTAGNQYGRDWNNIVSHWDYWKWSASAAAGSWFNSDAVSSSLGELFVVSEVLDSAGRYTISLRKKKRDGAITLVHTFYSAILAVAPSETAHPAIIRMPDESLLVAYVNYTTEDQTNITIHRSYDNGDTWQKITQRALIDNIDISASGYNVRKIKFAQGNNIVALWLELVAKSGTSRNRLAQYRSLDSGLSFRLIDVISTTAEGYFHQPTPISLPDGSTGVAFLDSASGLKFRRIPNSSIRLSGAGWASQEKVIYSGAVNWAHTVSSELQEGQVCAWYEDGRIFVVAQEYGTGTLYGFYSSDLGDNWNIISGGYLPIANDGIIYAGGDNASRLKNLSACQFEGRSVIIGHEGNSAHAIYLGGYSTTGYPAIVENPDESQFARWDASWLPVNLPSGSTYWTAGGLGTHTIGEYGLRIQTSTAIRAYTYTGAAGTYFDEGQLFRMRLRVVTGNSTINDYIAMVATQDSGVNSRMLNLRFKTGGFEIRSNAGVLQAVTHDMTAETEILIGWRGGNADIFYRTVDGAQAKDWTKISVTIPTYATGAGNTLRWGHVALFTGNLESYWQEFHVSSGTTAGYSDEMEKRGVIYPPFGEYLYIDGGLSITTISSPARGEDEYTIAPRYDFPIQAIFPDVALSPRIVWRSKTDTADNNIAFFIDQNVEDNERSYHLNDVYGLHLSNINFQKANLKRWTGSAWSLVAAIDISQGLQGTFTRSGHSIMPDVAGNGFYLHYNECVGWRAILQVGETKHVVKIKQNSEGVWGKNSDTKRAVLMIDTDLSDYSTLPTSGQIQLIPDRATILIDALDDVTLGDSALRLEIPTQDTLEGYFQIGTMLYGHLVAIAPQYQRGRSISYEPNIAEEETLDGMYFARKMSDGRRTASIAWTEPVDTTLVQSADPDYWQLSATAGAQPIANYGDAPFQMMGLYQQLANKDPLVYLPSIKLSDTQVINRYHDHILARSTGAVTIESVLGDESIDEVFRVATVNLVEIE